MAKLGRKIVWNKEKIDKAYYYLRQKYGRTPTSREFRVFCPGGLANIYRGRYDSSINSWMQFLNSNEGSAKRECAAVWSPSKIDEAFDSMKERLGRRPMAREFSKEYSRAYQLISKGLYPGIKSWRQYLISKGGEPAFNYIAPEYVDNHFDYLFKTLGKSPTAAEFVAESGGALEFIRKGRYSDKIHSWHEYVISRGQKSFKITVERVDKDFENLRRELGRIPTSREFKEINSGAIEFIKRGGYKLSINSWNQFIQFKAGKVTKIFWDKGKVDRVFQDYKKELGRVPSIKEFMTKFGGALSFILKGRYDSTVNTWCGFLELSGETNRSLQSNKSIGILESIIEGVKS